MRMYKRFITKIIIVAMLCAMAMPINVLAKKVHLNYKSVSLTVGQSKTLKIIDGKGKVKWSSSKKSVVTVNGRGKITGKKAGTAVIKAKIRSKTYKCRVTVKPETSFNGIYRSEDGSKVTISKKGGKYKIDIFLCRLTNIDDGVGSVKNNILYFSATDANGNPIKGNIKKSGKEITLTFSNSTWTYLPNGTKYQFYK